MKIKSALSAVAIAGMLVVTADYATMAATGSSLILGRSNTANRPTALTNTAAGPPLKLYTSRPGSTAPLAVNSSVRVPRLNADLLDGLDSSKFARKQAPVKVWRAAPLPGRVVSVSGSDVAVHSLPITVPSECGANTRHRYLVEHDAWWGGSGSIVEISLTVNSAAHQFGPGTSVVQPNSYASSASSRVVTLAPGAATLRIVASSAAATAFDPALRATDLGYTCAGGPTSRATGSARSAIPGR